MIEPTGYRARCDHPGCGAETRRTTVADLVAAAEAVGWRFNTRVDGQPAVRNGNDYCPVHRPRWHLLDGITENMADQLVLLLDDPTWRPRGAGQWRSARLMHGRGLLSRVVMDDEAERFTLNDDGRRAALEVKGRREEAALAVGSVGPEDEAGEAARGA